jgi:hypothetical protein
MASLKNFPGMEESMKSFRTLIFFLIGFMLLTAGLTAKDTLEQFNLAKEEAASLVLNALVNDTIPYGVVSEAFKAAKPVERPGMINSAVAWIKAYTKTPEFAQNYKLWHDENKPTPPAGGSAAEEMAKQKSEFQKMVEETKKNLKNVPPEMRKELEKSLNEAIAQQKEMEKNQEMQAAISQGLQEEQKNRQEEYGRKLREFEAKYPVDPKRLIALRLRSFLDLSAAIDFAAKLFDLDDLKIFADESYEKKPDTWKLCFRAGRESVQAARIAANSWLTEIEKR